jgi:hypothetical protein
MINQVWAAASDHHRMPVCRGPAYLPLMPQ